MWWDMQRLLHWGALLGWAVAWCPWWMWVCMGGVFSSLMCLGWACWLLAAWCPFPIVLSPNWSCAWCAMCGCCRGSWQWSCLSMPLPCGLQTSHHLEPILWPGPKWPKTHSATPPIYQGSQQKRERCLLGHPGWGYRPHCHLAELSPGESTFGCHTSVCLLSQEHPPPTHQKQVLQEGHGCCMCSWPQTTTGAQHQNWLHPWVLASRCFPSTWWRSKEDGQVTPLCCTSRSTQCHCPLHPSQDCHTQRLHLIYHASSALIAPTVTWCALQVSRPESSSLTWGAKTHSPHHAIPFSQVSWPCLRHSTPCFCPFSTKLIFLSLTLFYLHALYAALLLLLFSHCAIITLCAEWWTPILSFLNMAWFYSLNSSKVACKDPFLLKICISTGSPCRRSPMVYSQQQALHRCHAPQQHQPQDWNCQVQTCSDQNHYIYCKCSTCLHLPGFKSSPVAC